MPFTLSHAVAVLPGLRRDASGAVRGRGPLIGVALVAGALAPDVPYFAESLVRGMYTYGRTAHSTAGVVLVDPLIAAGLTVGWLFVRDPVLKLLPGRVRERVRTVLGGGPGGGSGRPWTARTAGWFWASAAAGASTHVIWDAFTHAGRWGVLLVPVLDREFHGMPLFQYAQYGSSAASLVLLGAWWARAVRNASPAAETPLTGDGAARRELPVWARLLGAAGIAGAAAVGAGVRCLHWYELYGGTIAGMVPAAMFGGGAGLAAGSLLYAAADRLLTRRRRGGGPGRPQWAADSQSLPTPTETSSRARSG
jgi:hypothetical protein